jgi:hypothetical protein
MEDQEEAGGAADTGAGDEGGGADYPTIEAPEDSSLPFAPPGSEDQSAGESE